LALAAAATLGGCGKDAPVPAGDSARATVARDSVAMPTPAPTRDDRGWIEAAGPVVYLPSDAGTVRLVLPLVPDDSVPVPTAATIPAAAAPATVDLFGPSGLVGRASVGEYSAASQSVPVPGCDAWPELPVRRDDASAGRWHVALASGVAEPLGLDSTTALATRDSTRMIADVIRATATSAATRDSAEALLARVPFAVLAARHGTLADGTELLVATVERRINAEADPRVEQTTLILERARGAKGWTVAWRERQYVAEDELVMVELLGGVRLRATGTPLLFLGLDFGDGTRVETLARVKPGEWRVRWSSAYTGC
jgi:hypothetical protein